MSGKLGIFMFSILVATVAPALSADVSNAGGAQLVEAPRSLQAQPDADASLKRALMGIAASKGDNDALLKAVFGKDERSARALLTRYPFNTSAPYTIDFDSHVTGDGSPALGIIHLAALKAPRFYGQPDPPWVGMVHMGHGWVDWDNWNPIGCCWVWH